MRKPEPFGRCISCGRPLTKLEWMFLDRMCDPCDAGEWSIHDFWKSALEAMKVVHGR